MATITVTGVANVTRKFKRIENLGPAIAPELDNIQEMLLKDAREQPRKASGAFSRMATPGQRRAYWAKVKSGEARHGPGGYVRSYTLMRGWQKTPMRVTATRIQIGIENEVPYAKFVQGKRRQPFHRASNWKTDTIIAREHSRVVRMRVQRAIKRITA